MVDSRVIDTLQMAVKPLGKTGDADLYLLTDTVGRSATFIVSNLQRIVSGPDAAYKFSLAKAQYNLAKENGAPDPLSKIRVPVDG